ncbi:cache domain-containing sensor histidine kinase [Paenibacillus piri]|uniref:Sensor histidine kinase n=1 Tax=Paenibacillus piri TaxID=2547395 RepID=A0A4R5KZW1_9BACL|nr:sensor histidine kinase [Paenibacillus piri]TDG00796.1 sensor histidine kinase [Paenibacillus piri]
MLKLKARSSSFQNKLMLSYLLIILIPVLSALLIFGLDFYNQTKRSYEDIMNQLNKRTSLVVTDFFSNISRNSYFYFTDNRLKRILEKKYVQSNLEFIDDSNYMQQAMDQILLMNGQLVGMSVTGINGRVYSSTSANTGYLNALLQELPKDKLRDGKITVSNAYNSQFINNQGKVVSIIRFLADLDGIKSHEVYAKLDIRFKLIENLFGGISESNSEVGTIVTAGEHLIYTSADAVFDEVAIQQIAAAFKRSGGHENQLMRLTVNGEPYMFAETLNELTDWTIIQFIPSRAIDNAFQKNIGKYVSISLICLVIAIFMAYFFSRRFFKPISKLIKTMKMADSGTLDRIADDENREDEIGKLMQSYNSMMHRLKESREKELMSSRLQKRAELNMLQAQINPHFLYNTLNTMHSIAELHRFEPISVMAQSLSSLYRYNLKSNDIVTIRMELEQIRNYVQIQQMRFLNKFQVIYEIDEQLHDYQILKFLLQPIVENAFYHGLEPKGGSGTLKLSIRKNGHTLFLLIEDDGMGISRDKAEQLNLSFRKPAAEEQNESKNHIGLRNVNARIKNFYGDEYWLQISSVEGQGTSVEMMIPAEKGELHDAYFGR